MEDFVYDPHRTVSTALVEVRTVLSRARTALEIVEQNDEIVVSYGEWVGRPAELVGRESVQHPDHDEMVKALREAVVALAPWEKHGAPLKRKKAT